MISPLEKNSRDQRFLEELRQIVLNNLNNEQFSVEQLAEEHGTSRSQLHKRLKKLKQKSVSQFIREIRLEEAMKLLQNDTATASEIAYQVGFSSPTYFNTCFKEFFGYPPGEVRFRSQQQGEEPGSSGQIFSTDSNNGGQITRQPTYKKQLFSLVAITALILLGVIWYMIRDVEANDAAASAENIELERSIAVLPFKDISPNKDQEALANAMVIEIINRLVKIEDLLVTSRASTFTYEASVKPTGEIAKELGVANILMGSVQKKGSALRVAVQLVDGSSDKFLWSEIYEGIADSVFAIQSNIAQQVAYELRSQVSPEVKQRIYKTPTKNMKAYSLFLQVDLRKTLDENLKLLSEAIQLDPGFADAYVEMAIEKLWRITVVRLYKPENLQEYLADCERLLRKGLDLDPFNARAHLFLGAYNLWFNWDFEKADGYFQNAMRLNPGLPLSTYTEFLLASGRFEEALQNSFRFIKANPNATFAWFTQGLCYSYLNNQQEVAEAIKIGEDKSGFVPHSYGQLFQLLNFLEKYDEVISRYEKLSDPPLEFPHFESMAAIAYGHSGKQEQVQEILNKLKLLSKESPIGSPAYYTAMIYAQTEETDLAFEWLEKGYRDHEINMHWLKVEPFFKPLYSDARWPELLRKVGFSD